MSARRSALTELRKRLARITIANGFNTDAGALIFLAEQPQLGEGDPDEAIAMVVGADEPGYQGEHVVVQLPVQVQAIAKAAADDPWMTVEAVIDDIHRAVENDLAGNPDHSLGGILVARGLECGSTEPLDREDGSTTVGAGVAYRLTFRRQWGAA